MTTFNETIIAQNEAIINLLQKIAGTVTDDTVKSIKRAEKCSKNWLEQVDEK